jgi:hypothetical protein
MKSTTCAEKLEAVFVRACGEQNLIDRMAALDTVSKRLGAWADRSTARQSRILKDFDRQPEENVGSFRSIKEILEAVSSGLKVERTRDKSLEKIKTGVMLTSLASTLSHTAALKAGSTLLDLAVMPKERIVEIFDAAKPQSKEHLAKLVP